MDAVVEGRFWVTEPGENLLDLLQLCVAGETFDVQRCHRYLACLERARCCIDVGELGSVDHVGSVLVEELRGATWIDSRLPTDHLRFGNQAPDSMLERLGD